MMNPTDSLLETNQRGRQSNHIAKQTSFRPITVPFTLNPPSARAKMTPRTPGRSKIRAVPANSCMGRGRIGSEQRDTRTANMILELFKGIIKTPLRYGVFYFLKFFGRFARHALRR